MSNSENIKEILKKIEECNCSNEDQIEEGIIGDLLAKFRSAESLTDKHRKIITGFWRKRSIAQMKLLEKTAMSAKRIIAKLKDPRRNPGLYKQINEIIHNMNAETNLLLGFIDNWEKMKVPSKLKGDEKDDLEDAAKDVGYDGEDEEIVIRRPGRKRLSTGDR
jgi:hypothetical protein